MNLIILLAMGAIAGYLSARLMGLEEKNMLLYIVIGVAGSMIGGLLAAMLGIGSLNGFTLYSLLISVLGSCLLLFIYRLLKRYLH